jgi:hypothetical protein
MNIERRMPTDRLTESQPMHRAKRDATRCGVRAVCCGRAPIAGAIVLVAAVLATARRCHASAAPPADEANGNDSIRSDHGAGGIPHELR